MRTDRGVLRAPLSSTRSAGGACSAPPHFQPPDAPLWRGLEVHPHDGRAATRWTSGSSATSSAAATAGASRPGEEARIGVGSYEPRQHVKDADRALAGARGPSAVRYQGNWFPHRLRAATGDGVFFVGDSAGHCFPLSGEGIRTAFYFGIACGRELRRCSPAAQTARRRWPPTRRSTSATPGLPRALRLQRLVPTLPPRALAAALRALAPRSPAAPSAGTWTRRTRASPPYADPHVARDPVSGPIVVVHGGAGGGVIRPDLAPALKDGLARAVEAGRSALFAGGNAVDAVVESVAVLENDEHFNAGRGAVLTADGDIEHDAAVMDGRRRRAGAVAALCGQPNPIRIARALLEEGRHGMLAGEGAMRFAEEQGFARVELDVLLTDHRRKQLAARQAGEEPEPAFGDPQPGIWTLEGDTVGAVVLDLDGHLAAGTSTGGIHGKLQGRVGDSPLVGGGLYANDRVCAVSATGTGERIMEAVAAHEVAAEMASRGFRSSARSRTPARSCRATSGSSPSMHAAGSASRATRRSSSAPSRSVRVRCAPGFAGTDTVR